MSQDTKDYYAGRDAYFNSEPLDRKKSQSWQEGWEDACFDDEEELNYA